ncbi:hypothetical protein FOZ63_010277, partial [Perkinsus olseni]
DPDCPTTACPLTSQDGLLTGRNDVNVGGAKAENDKADTRTTQVIPLVRGVCKRDHNLTGMIADQRDALDRTSGTLGGTAEEKAGLEVHGALYCRGPSGNGDRKRSLGPDNEEGRFKADHERAEGYLGGGEWKDREVAHAHLPEVGAGSERQRPF